MGTITTTREYTYSVPASEMFKATVLDAPVLFPEILAQYMELPTLPKITIDGDVDIGTVMTVQIPTAGGQFKSMKQRFDAINRDNYRVRKTWFQGDPMTPALLGALASNNSAVSSDPMTSLLESQVKDALDALSDKSDANKWGSSDAKESGSDDATTDGPNYNPIKTWVAGDPMTSLAESHVQKVLFPDSSSDSSGDNWPWFTADPKASAWDYAVQDILFNNSGSGGSICTVTTTYYPKHGAQLTDDFVEAFEAKVMGLDKTFEKYILANPDKFPVANPDKL